MSDEENTVNEAGKHDGTDDLQLKTIGLIFDTFCADGIDPRDWAVHGAQAAADMFRPEFASIATLPYDEWETEAAGCVIGAVGSAGDLIDAVAASGGRVFSKFTPDSLQMLKDAAHLMQSAMAQARSSPGSGLTVDAATPHADSPRHKRHR